VRARFGWSSGYLSSFLRIFYAGGGIVGVIGLVISLVVLVINLSMNIWKTYIFFQGNHGSTADADMKNGIDVVTPMQNSARMSDIGQLTPLLPGFNLPIGYIGYLFIAASVSLIVHEAGHAFAANVEGVRCVCMYACL
jgi:hypothetical protein